MTQATILAPVATKQTAQAPVEKRKPDGAIWVNPKFLHLRIEGVDYYAYPTKFKMTEKSPDYPIWKSNKTVQA